MKYIAIALAFGIATLSIWAFINTPPCEGSYKFSLGGDQYFLFECTNNTPSLSPSTSPSPSSEITGNTENIHLPSTDQTVIDEAVCTGSIDTVLNNNIAEAGRFIAIENDLRLYVLSMSAVETDISIQDLDDNEIIKETIRVSDEISFIYSNSKYNLVLNSIRDPLTTGPIINVTMHKVKCT
jgi:hypothetical protein